LKPKALIAMSGGVDSSVAALLTKEAGFDCVGVTMKLFENEDIAEPSSRACCSLKDADDAARVCAAIGIPFYVFDFTADFRVDVIERFVRAYDAGRTPNPCIDCNRYIKYDRLYHRARAMGFDCLVTGHYARVEQIDGEARYRLKRARDEAKDQSYVLYALTQEQLAHTRFPLGALTKDEARRLAEARGFVNARKRDSQDICFVPGGRYADFIETYTGKLPPEGNFVDTDGRVIGKHRGVARYTIGQRKGLGKTFGKPMYVVEIRPDTNEVVLGANADLYRKEVKVRDVNLIARDDLTAPRRVTAKIRYNQAAAPATVTRTDSDALFLVFDEAQRAVTKGQAAVLYDGDIVIGGGVID
jgi:tRNA-specific 2-thiouridylase